MLLLAGLLPGVLRTDCCARMQQGVAAHQKSGGQYPGQHGLSDNGSGGTERGDLYNQPDESKPEIPSGNGNAVKVRRKCYRSLRQRCYDEIYKNTQKRVYSKCRITKSFLGWGTIDVQ